MRRRSFLSAAIAAVSLGACGDDMITGYVNTQSKGWTSYSRPGVRATISRPRLVHSSGGFAHFAGLQYFPVSGKVVCRINTGQDTPGADTGYHLISSDGGVTWGNGYTVTGSHTSNEPLTYVGGQYVGGTFNFTFPGGDNTKTTCPRVTLTDQINGYTQTPGGVTFNGYPHAIATALGYPAISWFGTIIQFSSNNWITTVNAIYEGIGTDKCFCECFKSTDQGVTWNYLSSLPTGASEGVDEPSMELLGDGRVILVSRVGVQPIVRSFSSDQGVTWGALAALTPWCKAPYIRKLTNGALIITTGFITRPAEPDQYGNPPPGGYCPAAEGLYMSTDPDATSWPVVDLMPQHNGGIGDGYKIDYDLQFPPRWSSGYTCSAEIAPNRVLICYDRDGSFAGEGHQVFVVEALIERV